MSLNISYSCHPSTLPFCHPNWDPDSIMSSQCLTLGSRKIYKAYAKFNEIK
ncbi:MAG: hypothetical protein ACR5LA_01820 [Wolbachia sp.]